MNIGCENYPHKVPINLQNEANVWTQAQAYNRKYQFNLQCDSISACVAYINKM